MEEPRSPSLDFYDSGARLDYDVEDWAAVPGMDSLLWVSTLGRVWQYNSQRRKWMQPKTPTVLRHGYPTVVHQQRVYRVHYLVAITFIGPPPSPEHTVDHIAKYNGDWESERKDNRVGNLRWASRAEQRHNQSKSAKRIDRREEHTAQLHSDEVFRLVDGILVSQYGRTQNKYEVSYMPVPNKGMEYALVGTSRRPVHVLVALGFPEIVGEPLPGQDTVDHIDRNKSNNCAVNLRWANRSEQQYNTSRQHGDIIGNNLKDCVDVRGPGEMQWISYQSCSAASRGIKKATGKYIAAQSIAQFIRRHPNGGTIKLRQNAGWSFRSGR